MFSRKSSFIYCEHRDIKIMHLHGRLYQGCCKKIFWGNVTTNISCTLKSVSMHTIAMPLWCALYIRNGFILIPKWTLRLLRWIRWMRMRLIGLWFIGFIKVGTTRYGAILLCASTMTCIVILIVFCYKLFFLKMEASYTCELCNLIFSNILMNIRYWSIFGNEMHYHVTVYAHNFLI